MSACNKKHYFAPYLAEKVEKRYIVSYSAGMHGRRNGGNSWHIVRSRQEARGPVLFLSLTVPRMERARAEAPARYEK